MLIPFVVVLCTCLSATSPSRTATGEIQPVQPISLLRKARNYWSVARYPHYISYGIVVKSVTDGQALVRHYDAVYSSESNTARVRFTSDEEQSQAVVPHGTALKVQFTISFGGSGTIQKIIVPADTFPDYVGVPILSPVYNFGLARYLKPLDNSANPAGLQTIAHVYAGNDIYRATIAGVELLNGETTYHLHLQPWRLPNKYRIRDLWIDAKTGATLQMIVAGNFQGPSSLDKPWVITYQTIQGLQYLRSEHAEGPLKLNGRILSSITIDFQRISTSVTPEDVLGLSFPELNPRNSLIEPSQ